jgi:hypothetical protein
MSTATKPKAFRMFAHDGLPLGDRPFIRDEVRSPTPKAKPKLHITVLLPAPPKPPAKRAVAADVKPKSAPKPAPDRAVADKAAMAEKLKAQRLASEAKLKAMNARHREFHADLKRKASA